MANSKSGYGYRYRVGVGDEYRDREGDPIPRWRTYILEVRTNFILKPIGAEEILIDTERFGDRLAVADNDVPRNCGANVFRLLSGKNMVDAHIRERLSKYCMPDAYIRSLAQMAFDFVRDPRFDSFHTIPILVGIDVYTVQLEGEPLHATVNRSIKPDSLVPLRLRWRWHDPMSASSGNIRKYFHKLPVVRVRKDYDVRVKEDVDVDIDSCSICLNESNTGFEPWLVPDKYDFHEKHSVGLKEGLGLMEACPICLLEPIVGAKIAPLPCKHAFHDHCISRWFFKSQSCPVCLVEIKLKDDYSKFLK